VNKIYQTTIAKIATFTGIGLHSGKKSKIKILPADADTGIVFKRVDLKDKNFVKANFKNVTSAKLCTTIENEYGIKVSTVEHLLAAFFIAEIDNALVEIDNEEVPIMDGSAKNFLEIIREKGINDLSKKRKYLKVFKNIELRDGSKNISIEPNDGSFEVDFQLNYTNPIIGKQKNFVDFNKSNLEIISNSRTFCLREDIEKIKKMGLAKGGSLDNAIVVDESRVLNNGGLRNEKEFVNHKILDLAGDFMLSGYRVLGSVKCYQGGHLLTNKFLKKIFQDLSLFEIFSFKDFKIQKKITNFSSDRIVVNA
tara:strand:+ start:2920 stop:3846 length:927 start_codon:yes stop_codon:yes gene_type:complete